MRQHIKQIHNSINDLEINIVIPAAGMGRRMKTYGCKSLIQMTKNKRVIDLQLDAFKRVFNKHKVILVSGFDSDRLMDHVPKNIIQVENERFYETNVARSIGLGLRAIADASNVLIVMGDLVFNDEAIKAIDYSYSSLVLSTQMSDEEVGCVINNGYVDNLMYDLEFKWGHIAYLTGNELELMKKLSFDRNNQKRFCFELLNEVINAGGKFKAVWNKDVKLIDIDTSKDIQLAQEIL